MSIEIANQQHAPCGSSAAMPQYRALATSAVASLIVGGLSVLSLFDWSLLTLPIVGTLLSLYALRKISANSSELTGAALAKIGLGLSCLFMLVSPTWLTVQERLDVPDGYLPIDYSVLQPDPAQAGQVIPPSALALDGKRVYIKGYPYPGEKPDDIQEFLLVRDQGDCCFGGNPKITDRILVKLADPLRLSYKPRIHSLGGTFHVEQVRPAGSGAKGGVFYHLDADHLK